MLERLIVDSGCVVCQVEQKREAHTVVLLLYATSWLCHVVLSFIESKLGCRHSSLP